MFSGSLCTGLSCLVVRVNLCFNFYIKKELCCWEAGRGTFLRPVLGFVQLPKS